MIRVISIIICLVLLYSCSSTKYIDREVPIETIRTEQLLQKQKDSIYIHDSINIYTNNDTIFQTKYRYIYKYLTKVDTICKVDTVQVPIRVTTTKIREVNKIHKYQLVLMYLGGIFVLIILYKIVKFGKSIIK